MRLVVALIVVLFAQYPIAGRPEPAVLSFFLHNPRFGNYAVESFFVISGLLVTRSFLSGRKVGVALHGGTRAAPVSGFSAGVRLSVAVGVLCNPNPPAVTLADDRTWTYSGRT